MSADLKRAIAYCDAAKVFAKVALEASSEGEAGFPAVVQNAWKAIEFALTGLALSQGRGS